MMPAKRLFKQPDLFAFQAILLKKLGVILECFTLIFKGLTIR